MTVRRHPAEIINDFKEYPFFKSFSPALLMQVCTLTQVVTFSKGSQVLKQGQVNEGLFFINRGEVDILLDGELVTHLSQRGEVLGEMSVISKQPVSAEIRATTDLECYFIKADDFSYVAPRDQEHFQFLLYRIYSDVLSHRLRATNSKARQFEITNRDLVKAQESLQEINTHLEKMVELRTVEVKQKAAELEESYAKLEQQNAVLVAGFKKLTEQTHVRDRTLQMMRGLLSHRLEPMKMTLLQVQGRVGVEDKTSLDLTLSEIQDLSVQVKELIEQFQSEKSIESRKILLVEPEKKQQLVAKMALGGTGVSLDIAGEAGLAEQSLHSSTFDLIMCDVTSSELLKRVHDMKLPGELVLLTSPDMKVHLSSLRDLSFVNHVVSRDLRDRTFTVKNILTTITKILNRDYFGLEKYLSWGVDVQERKVSRSEEREEYISEMESHFKSMGVRSSLLDRCRIVAEEMLMNAIYDAPVDEGGRSLYNHLPRTSEVHLKADQAANLRYACDGNLIAISVADPFGALPKKIILDYLESCYQGQAGQINAQQGKGGAGRGLHQIIENSDLTVFNVRKKIRTEVIAMINIDTSNREDGIQPTFHYFFS